MLIQTQTRIQLSQHYDVPAGSTITEMGLALIAANDGGVMKAIPSAAGASDILLGFAMGHTLVPSSLPYEATLTAVGTTLTLPFTPISGQIRLLDGAQVLAAGNPGTTANQYSISGNVVTLHSGQENKAIRVSLRYAATLEQAIAEYGEGLPGQIATRPIQNRIGVITKGRVATTNYDASVAYTAGTAVKSGANGFVTSGGSGATWDNVLVAEAPTPGAAYIVLEVL